MQAPFSFLHRARRCLSFRQDEKKDRGAHCAGHRLQIGKRGRITTPVCALVRNDVQKTYSITNGTHYASLNGRSLTAPPVSGRGCQCVDAPHCTSFQASLHTAAFLRPVCPLHVIARPRKGPWQSVSSYRDTNGILRKSRPISLFGTCPKRETVLGLQREKGASTRVSRRQMLSWSPRISGFFPNLSAIVE